MIPQKMWKERCNQEKPQAHLNGVEEQDSIHRAKGTNPSTQFVYKEEHLNKVRVKNKNLELLVKPSYTANESNNMISINNLRITTIMALIQNIIRSL